MKPSNSELSRDPRNWPALGPRVLMTSPVSLLAISALTPLISSTPDRTRRAPAKSASRRCSSTVLMAILLTLPRQKGAPDQPLGENVTALKKRLA